MATPRITVCGLGPGGADRLTEATLSVLRGPDPVHLRTARHPTAGLAPNARSFDEIYEWADTFDDVYRAIVDRLLDEAGRHGRVVYAVPGSPLVLERSVRVLRETASTADAAVEVELMPALSFLDEVWARLGVDPIDDGVRLVDGHRFATQAADQRGPLLVAHAHAPWVLSDIKLAIDAGPEQRVVILQGLGTPDEHVVEVPWPELDRAVEPDHLTTLYLPEVVAPVGAELARSIEMMGRLRRECPWDREQSHQSLRRFLLEEAHEVVDVIDRLGRADDEEAVTLSIELEEELGDLWFQILFHAELAAESGWFTLADVARTLTDKMVNRHPHVYGDTPADDVVTVAGWEELKRQEKGRASAMDDIPLALPALSRADKTLKRAEQAGWPADHGPVGEAVESLLAGVDAAGETGDGGVEDPGDEIGRLLLAVVRAARRRGVNAEEALRQAIARATDRYRSAETAGRPSADWVRG